MLLWLVILGESLFMKWAQDGMEHHRKKDGSCKTP